MKIIKSEPLPNWTELSYGDKLFIGEYFVELADDDDDASIPFEFDTVGEMRKVRGIPDDVNICYMEIDWTEKKPDWVNKLHNRLDKELN